MIIDYPEGASLADFIGNDETAFVERILEKGYFPEGIPPVFEVENLHEASLKVVSKREYTTDKPTEHSKFNASKRGGQRRIFSVPNPTFMFDAATFFLSH